MKVFKWVMASVLVMATFAIASPAGASSVGNVVSISRDLTNDMEIMGNAAESMDVDGLGDACSSLWGHTATAMGFTRPKAVPKSAWRHTMAGWRLMNKAAAACESGARDYDFDLIEKSSVLISQASNEINTAASLMPN